MSRHLAVLVRIIAAHRGTPQERTLGRKKVEKLSHLIEQHLGIDLGRQPRRAAAGPLDMPRLKAVCLAAEERGIFQTIEPEQPGVDDDGGEAEPSRLAVRFEPRERFPQAVEDAAGLLGRDLAGVDRLIGHLVKLNSDQAEIVATLYSVWHDLLTPGNSPSDEEIFRAFWGWHPDKARFTQTQLFVELAWMRQEKIVPGYGRARNEG